MICLPLSWMIPSAANSFRHLCNENFWMANDSAISWRDFWSIKSSDLCSLDCSNRKIATFSLTVWSVSIRTLRARLSQNADRSWMKLNLKRSSILISICMDSGVIRRIVVGLLATILTGTILFLPKMNAESTNEPIDLEVICIYLPDGPTIRAMISPLTTISANWQGVPAVRYTSFLSSLMSR